MTNKTPEQLAEEWIQTKYPADVKLVGHVRHPERESDFIEGYKAAKEEERWIPCGEEMPKDGQEIMLGHYRYSGKWWWCSGIVDMSDDGAFVDYELDGEAIKTDCYWKPLPQPPTKETNDDRK